MPLPRTAGAKTNLSMCLKRREALSLGRFAEQVSTCINLSAAEVPCKTAPFASVSGRTEKEVPARHERNRNSVAQKFKIGQKNELVSSNSCTKLPYPAARTVRAYFNPMNRSIKARRPHMLGLRACIAFQKSRLISKQLLYFLPYRINNRLWRKLLLERLIPRGKFYNPFRAGLGAHHNPQRHAQ